MRGTNFEIYLRPDKAVLVKLFTGKLNLTGRKNAADLKAGQQVIVGVDGTVGAPSPIAAEPGDPFALQFQAEQAAAVGAQAGTVQSFPSGPVGPGGSSTASYTSGGDVNAVLSYPGSLMKLTVTDPSGKQYTAQSGSPVKIRIPNRPVGAYKATATAVDVPAGGELLVLTFSGNPPCQSGNVDQNGVVRQVFSNKDIQNAIQQSGASGINASIGGLSRAGVPVSASFSQGGLSISGSGVVYAAPPNVGIVITSANLGPLRIGAQFAAQAAAASIPLDFSVDRVYACRAGVMVIEGHR